MTDKTIAFSLLDLAPIPEGSSAREAFSHYLDLARLSHKRGYHRGWLAEHHNMTGIASAATSVLIGYLAANTTTLHLGSGGVMLPTTHRWSLPNSSARSIHSIRGESIWGWVVRQVVTNGQ